MLKLQKLELSRNKTENNIFNCRNSHKKVIYFIIYFFIIVPISFAYFESYFRSER